MQLACKEYKSLLKMHCYFEMTLILRASNVECVWSI